MLAKQLDKFHIHCSLIEALNIPDQRHANHFIKFVSDISRIHDCSWICRKQFIICLHLISCPYSLTIFLMSKGVILTMWNLHMISWLQASHNPLISFQVFSHLIVSKSNSTSAPYVALQIQIGWRRVKTCRLCSAKHCLLRLVKAQQNLTRAVDWLDSLNDLGGLLLSCFSPICSPSFSSKDDIGKT